MFSSSGTYLSNFGSEGSGNGQFYNIYSLAINQTTGNVYVTDGDGDNRVEEFKSDGSYIAQWGSTGTGNGQFQSPSGIGINQTTGNVYVSDLTNDNVQEFSSTGSYTTQWGDLGSGNGQFNSPYYLTVNQANGNVYVADTSNNRVEVFSSSGTYISQFGSSGGSNGQFNIPYGIDINPSNSDVYVADGNNYRIQEFSYYDNLAQETIPSSSNNLNLTLPSGSNITSESIAPASVSDSSYNYPLGLFSYTFSTANNVVGATVPIQITFQTDLTPSQVSARYYNPDTKSYSTIPGATITSTTVNGQPALLLSYDITDGGSLDEDGVANGVIVDPVGLATLKTSTNTLTAPDTGDGKPSNLSSGFITLLIIGTTSVIVATGLVINKKY